jgi:hypothetical protein
MNPSKHILVHVLISSVRVPTAKTLVRRRNGFPTIEQMGQTFSTLTGGSTSLITDIDTTPLITDIDTTPLITDIDTIPLITDIDTTPLITDIDTIPLITDRHHSDSRSLKKWRHLMSMAGKSLNTSTGANARFVAEPCEAVLFQRQPVPGFRWLTSEILTYFER